VSSTLTAEEAASDLEDKLPWVCVDCGAPSPKTRSAHNLISSEHGWRLSRVPDIMGGHRFEWRCPACWAEFKRTPKPSVKPPPRKA